MCSFFRIWKRKHSFGLESLFLWFQKLSDGNFNGWKTFCITLDGKIQFFQLKDLKDEEKNKEEKINIYELKFLGEKECPLFSRDKSGCNIYETPLSKYIAYCEVVFDKLNELESIIYRMKNLTKKLELLGMPFERNVIFEKTNKNE